MLPEQPKTNKNAKLNQSGMSGALAIPQPIYAKNIRIESQDTPLQLAVVQADITKLPVEAIVNAANSTLLGGGGVDGAIHRVAGPELLAYCRTLNGCATGEVKMSPAFKLPSHYVLHTVGPIWHGGGRGEAELLARCYQGAIELAVAHEFTSLAFPAISTGVYGYPLMEATQVAVAAVQESLLQFAATNKDLALKQVIFCCYSAADAEVYAQVLQAS